MGVDEVGVARGAARCAHEPGQEERQREHEPRPAAEVADDPVPVGDPEVAEVRRRDDLDVDPGRPNVLDRVSHEVTGDVVRVSRIRRRQHDDPHVPGRLSLPPGRAGLREGLTPLAALQPAARTSVRATGLRTASDVPGT